MTPAELVDRVPFVVWVLVVDPIAVYRLTRLLTLDSFPPIAWLRTKVTEQWWPESKWSVLATCPWCVSPWLAAVVVAARLLAPAWWSPVALVLTYSAVAGIVTVVLVAPRE